MTTPRIAVVTGAAPHTDPWHGLDETSLAVVTTLGGVAALTTAELDQSTLTDADVVVLNVSGDLAVAPADSSAILDALEALSARGAGIVALHSSSLAFRDSNRWAELVGGRWVPGVSGHPQIGRALVQATGETDVVTTDFVTYDERYTALETAADVTIAAFHTEDGVTHPLVWLREATAGRGRVAYSALGHGAEAYESANADLLRALVAWAAG